MKKAIVFLLSVVMLVSAAGCSGNTAEPTVFSIDDYGLQLTADSTFREKTGGSFDLQITNGKAYVSIMAYKYIDLPADTTPLDVYETQNADLFGKREAVTAIEADKTQAVSHGTMTYALYSAQRDGVKNYYATYMMDFPEDETFAWVLITATPSYLDANRDSLHSIVCSLAPTE